MKYVIDIPEEIKETLEKRATATGEDVVHLIQMAVVSFVRSDAPWSVVGRRPDPPLHQLEITPPCDLPRSAPRLIPIEKVSRRHPDPITETV